jgi:2,3-bisphosphoglycerate-independent phosphoglycerate mutase
MNDFESYKILVLPDHPTPLSIKTHAADPIPYAIYSNKDGERFIHGEAFDEVSVTKSGIMVEKGFELIERFLNPGSYC